MNKFIKFFLVFLVNACFSLQIFATEPENLSQFKNELAFYHDSGQYQYDIKQITDEAIAYLQKRIDENNTAKIKQKLAIVLDIDETSLSNYADMYHLNFGGDQKLYDHENELSHDPAIPNTLALYNFAKANHVAVFFITGRHPFLREATERNLQIAGYKDWDGLYFRPLDDHQKSVIPFKSSIRKQITQQGYDIVLSLGDQFSDLSGGYADNIFKLPNPYYYIP